MKVVGLVSGGKDSCYNMMQCVAEGHEIVALANLRPKEKDELDSYMFQTVGHQAIDLYAEAMGVPLFRRVIEGSSIANDKDYKQTEDDEVEDLFALLKQVKDEVGVQGVSVGAVLSDYQRVRVEHVCGRLGLTALAYLWRRSQEELLNEMIKCHVEAILIKVAVLGLQEKHLMKSLSEIQPHMLNMKKKYDLNVCGEGGEYETFTLDCPLFKKRIVIDETETVMHSDDAFAPVAYINLKKMHLENKNENRDVSEVLRDLPMTRSSMLAQELFGSADIAWMNHAPAQAPSTVCVSCIENRLTGSYMQKYRLRNGWNFISGVHATIVEGQSIEESAKTALDQLLVALHSLDLTASDLTAMHLYVQNMQNFARINQVYKTYFNVNPPIRICVEAGLPSNVLLQVDCVAYKSDTRHTMHVQGLSHWAPANIGPYSQSVKVDDNIFIAGQIAMVPANLSLIAGGVLAESRLSLQHVTRILQAMHTGCALQDLTLVVCYVTSQENISIATAEWKKALEKCRNEATQNDVSYDEDALADPIVQYVVVPALPKAALVEWQTVAKLHCRHRTGRGIQKRYTGYMTESVYITAQDSDSLLAFKILLELESSQPKEDEKTVREYLEAILSAAKDCATRANSQYPLIPALRIFYRQDLIGLQTLSKVYQDLRVSASVPSASFVPALNFDSDHCVLSASAALY